MTNKSKDEHFIARKAIKIKHIRERLQFCKNSLL